MEKPNLPIKTFATPKAWETWLSKNHEKSPGVWLRMYKKASKKKSVNYDEALDVALCYGWIDAVVNKFDAESYIQKFVHRRPKSLWSKRNREHVARLIKEGKMQSAGLQEVTAAKKDGRWNQAYDAPGSAVVPADFLKALNKDKKAKAFFATLNKANTYAIIWRLQTAKKPETRERRLKVILEMLKRGEKLH